MFCRHRSMDKFFNRGKQHKTYSANKRTVPRHSKGTYKKCTIREHAKTQEVLLRRHAKKSCEHGDVPRELLAECRHMVLCDKLGIKTARRDETQRFTQQQVRVRTRNIQNQALKIPDFMEETTRRRHYRSAKAIEISKP